MLDIEKKIIQLQARRHNDALMIKKLKRRLNDATDPKIMNAAMRAIKETKNPRYWPSDFLHNLGLNELGSKVARINFSKGNNFQNSLQVVYNKLPVEGSLGGQIIDKFEQLTKLAQKALLKKGQL